MHGISPQQFAESVSSFLVPYYLALAAMNGIAAYLMWQKSEPVTYFGIPTAAASRFAFTNALAVDDRRAGVRGAGLAGGRRQPRASMPQDAAGVSRLRQRKHRAR